MFGIVPIVFCIERFAEVLCGLIRSRRPIYLPSQFFRIAAAKGRNCKW